MDVGNSNINTLSQPKNPPAEVLKFLKSWPEKTLSLEELKARNVEPIIRSLIKSWILDYKIKDQKLLEIPKEGLDKYPIDVELLIKTAEEEALKWDMEHSNNLYIRYKVLLDHGYRPEPLKSKADWSEFSNANRIYTLAYYVMEALKRDADYVPLASIDKPVTFYYCQGKKGLTLNQRAYEQFIRELGIEEDEPLVGENLALLIIRRYGYSEESIRGFYEQIVRDLIKPSKMRLPSCIEAIAFKPLFNENEEALKILASWIKYYSKGFNNGRMLKEEDNRIALFSYMVTRLYDQLIEKPWEIIEKFKEYYREAKPFKCPMVEAFQEGTRLAICNYKCPFKAPISILEEVLASVENVELYGSDYISIEHPRKKFMEGLGSLSPSSKLIQKFTGFLGEIYGNPFMDPKEALEILKALLERARYVSNYLSPLVAVEEWFKEEMERLLEDGALPWELRAKDRPFLSKDGKVLYVHRDLIQMDLLAGGPEGYTTQKLIRDLKKLPNSPIIGISMPIKVRKDAFTEEVTNAKFWMISTKWLEDQGIKFKIQVPTLEGEPVAQEDPGEDIKDLGSMERIILEMSKEPVDLDKLVEEVSRIFKVDEEKVIGVVTSLMARDLLKMEEGAKIRRVLNE